MLCFLPPFRAYDPADYEHLHVSQEIKELFQYITRYVLVFCCGTFQTNTFVVVIVTFYCSLFRYTPQSIELEHKMKPFNPDFIPAVGDIDAFLKVITSHLCGPFPPLKNFSASCSFLVLDLFCVLEWDSMQCVVSNRSFNSNNKYALHFTLTVVIYLHKGVRIP